MTDISIIKDDIFLKHKPGHTHPEHPHRIKTIYRMLEKDFIGGVNVIQPVMATLEQLELIHTPTYIKKVLKTANILINKVTPFFRLKSFNFRVKEGDRENGFIAPLPLKTDGRGRSEGKSNTGGIPSSFFFQ